ncbi:MAG: SUMF1/EgtB/PvdO family nonheme iron enzyme [Patescibacteria group bacterium]|nr:SUMF1/EgtB/PvdO family nonheme iron enzyme [Patescibacteria group bacterium]
MNTVQRCASLPMFLAVAALAVPASAEMVTISHGGTSVGIDFVTVGNSGNAADANANANRNGYGAVNYVYKMGTYEVTRNQWDTVAGAAGITIGVGSPRFSGNQPVTEVSWYGAAQFCNWLTTGDKYVGAYTFTFNAGATAITGVSIDRTYRNDGGVAYVIPNENEWYKAAYYDPNKNGTGGYWLYGTGQDDVPTPLPDGGGTAGAVYNRHSGGTYPGMDYPESVLLAGSSNAYGTIAQSGNAFEWIEDYYSGSSGDRVRRGASYANNEFLIAATWRGSRPATSVDPLYNLGFRVALIPEPAGMIMLICGTMTCLLWRRRGAH